MCFHGWRLRAGTGPAGSAANNLLPSFACFLTVLPSMIYISHLCVTMHVRPNEYLSMVESDHRWYWLGLIEEYHISQYLGAYTPGLHIAQLTIDVTVSWQDRRNESRLTVWTCQPTESCLLLDKQRRIKSKDSYSSHDWLWRISSVGVIGRNKLSITP